MRVNVHQVNRLDRIAYGPREVITEHDFASYSAMVLGCNEAAGLVLIYE